MILEIPLASDEDVKLVEQMFYAQYFNTDARNKREATMLQLGLEFRAMMKQALDNMEADSIFEDALREAA